MSPEIGTEPLILIGEADPVWVERLRAMLEGRYRVEFARDGLSLLERAKVLKPNLIVMELLLPKMDGFQVCGELKSNPETAAIPVLVISALLAKERAEQVAEAFVPKPLDEREFLAEVERLMKSWDGA